MNKFLELITVPIGTNGQSRFELSGDYFEIIESAYPVTVLLEDRNGAQIGRMKGAEASYFLRNTEYAAITIASEKAQTLQIAFGSGEAGTRRTAGIVQVVDGGKGRTLADMAYWGYGYCGAVASNLSFVQLWNPGGSGKRLVVEQVSYASIDATQQIFHLGYNVTALANLQATVKNKNIGSTASIAEIRTQNNPANLSVGFFADLYCPLKENATLRLSEPIILPPGAGLVVDGNAVGVSANFEYYEEKI